MNDYQYYDEVLESEPNKQVEISGKIFLFTALIEIFKAISVRGRIAYLFKCFEHNAHKFGVNRKSLDEFLSVYGQVLFLDSASKVNDWREEFLKSNEEWKSSIEEMFEDSNCFEAYDLRDTYYAILGVIGELDAYDAPHFTEDMLGETSLDEVLVFFTKDHRFSTFEFAAFDFLSAYKIDYSSIKFSHNRRWEIWGKPIDPRHFQFSSTHAR